jgi:hypothetical protein
VPEPGHDRDQQPAEQDIGEGTKQHVVGRILGRVGENAK